jgi:hypothetical protein
MTVMWWKKQAKKCIIYTQRSCSPLVVASKKKGAGVFDMSGWVCWELKVMVGFGTQQAPTASHFVIKMFLRSLGLSYTFFQFQIPA